MYIRHKRFMDVAIETDSFAYGKCLARWINMGYTKSWYLPAITEYVEIKDRRDWEKCTNPEEVKCLRDGDWIQL